MPTTNGVLKTKTLKLQGSGNNNGVHVPDYKLEVQDDEFHIKRGNVTLMTVEPDNDTVYDTDSGNTTNNTINFEAKVEFNNDVMFNGELKIDNMDLVATVKENKETIANNLESIENNSNKIQKNLEKSLPSKLSDSLVKRKNQFDIMMIAEKMSDLVATWIDTPNSVKTFSLLDIYWDRTQVISPIKEHPETPTKVSDIVTFSDLIEIVVANLGHSLVLSPSMTDYGAIGSSYTWDNGWSAACANVEETDNALTQHRVGNALKMFNSLSKTMLNYAIDTNGQPISDGRYTTDLNHVIALRIMLTYTSNLVDSYSNDNTCFRVGWHCEYMPVDHKAFGLFYQYYSSYYPCITVNLGLYADEDWEYQPFSIEQVRAWPNQFMKKFQALELRIKYMKENMHKYHAFKPILAGQPDWSGSYQGDDLAVYSEGRYEDSVNGTGDTEGYKLYKELTHEFMKSDDNFVASTIGIYYEPVEEFLAKNPDKTVMDYTGGNRKLQDMASNQQIIGSNFFISNSRKDLYIEDDDMTVYSMLTRAKKFLSDEEAEILVSQCEDIWNSKIRPLVTDLYNLFKEFVDNAANDDFPGMWRMKIKHVTGVLRDEDGLAHTVVVPHEVTAEDSNGDEIKTTVQVNIPFDPETNEVQATNQSTANPNLDKDELLELFETTQDGMKEMQKVYNDGLKLALNINDGGTATYLGVKKSDTDKGVRNGATTPYSSAKEILANYKSTNNVVDGNLPNVVYESGVSLRDFFDDFKDYYYDKFVKLNYELFYPSATAFDNTTMGLYKNVEVDDVLRVLGDVSKSRSDVSVLGRHFGYNADGTMKDDEWIDIVGTIDNNVNTTFLPTSWKKGYNYKWSYDKPVGQTGKYVFDYIHHQQYRMPTQVVNGETVTDFRMSSFTNEQNYIDETVNSDGIYVAVYKNKSKDAAYDIGRQGTYVGFRADYANQILCQYILENGVNTLFDFNFLVEEGYLSYVNKHSPENVAIRQACNDHNKVTTDDSLKRVPMNEYKTLYQLYMEKIASFSENDQLLLTNYPEDYKIVRFYNTANRENNSGSANSGSGVDFKRNIIYISQGYSNSTPAQAMRIEDDIGTFLHEGALGHGFDELGNNMNTLLRKSVDLSWLSTSSVLPFDDEYFNYADNVTPGGAVLGEGWATFGEFVGVVYDMYITIDENGLSSLDEKSSLKSIITGLNSVSRLSSRQIIDTGMHTKEYAYTFARCVKEQYEISGIPKTDQFFRNMLNRFIIGWAQQTTYAGGLIGNLAINSYLTETLGDNYDFKKFVQFRIKETDYVMGATLSEIVQSRIDYFKLDPSIPTPA
jgi:hypothetical protein